MTPFWILLELRMMKVMAVTIGALIHANSSQIITINKPTPGFLQARCPSCHPTNSFKALALSHSLSLSLSLSTLTGHYFQVNPS